MFLCLPHTHTHSPPSHLLITVLLSSTLNGYYRLQTTLQKKNGHTPNIYDQSFISFLFMMMMVVMMWPFRSFRPLYYFRFMNFAMSFLARVRNM